LENLGKESILANIGNTQELVSALKESIKKVQEIRSLNKSEKNVEQPIDPRKLNQKLELEAEKGPEKLLNILIEQIDKLEKRAKGIKKNEDKKLKKELAKRRGRSGPATITTSPYSPLSIHSSRSLSPHGDPLSARNYLRTDREIRTAYIPSRPFKHERRKSDTEIDSAPYFASFALNEELTREEELELETKKLGFENESLKRKIKNISKKNDELGEEKSSNSLEISRLKSENETLSQENEHLISENRAYKNKISTLNNEIVRLKEENNEKAKQEKVERESNNRLVKEKKDLEKQLNAAQEEATKSTQEVERQ